MKIKFMLLYFAAALAFVVGLSNCAKDSPTAIQATPENPAGLRGACDITITAFGNLQICGTQTNATPCAPNTLGQENVAAGIHNYAIAPPANLRLTNVGNSNPGQDALYVQIESNGQTYEYFIRDGDFQDLVVDDNCKIQ